VPFCTVKAPGFGDRRKAITEDWGIKLENVKRAETLRQMRSSDDSRYTLTSLFDALQSGQLLCVNSARVARCAITIFLTAVLLDGYSELALDIFVRTTDLRPTYALNPANSCFK
jgi:hypothetical protein